MILEIFDVHRFLTLENISFVCAFMHDIRSASSLITICIIFIDTDFDRRYLLISNRQIQWINGVYRLLKILRHIGFIPVCYDQRTVTIMNYM